MRVMCAFALQGQEARAVPFTGKAEILKMTIANGCAASVPVPAVVRGPCFGVCCYRYR